LHPKEKYAIYEIQMKEGDGCRIDPADKRTRPREEEDRQLKKKF